MGRRRDLVPDRAGDRRQPRRRQPGEPIACAGPATLASTSRPPKPKVRLIAESGLRGRRQFSATAPCPSRQGCGSGIDLDWHGCRAGRWARRLTAVICFSGRLRLRGNRACWKLRARAKGEHLRLRGSCCTRGHDEDQRNRLARHLLCGRSAWPANASERWSAQVLALGERARERPAVDRPLSVGRSCHFEPVARRAAPTAIGRKSDPYGAAGLSQAGLTSRSLFTPRGPNFLAIAL